MNSVSLRYRKDRWMDKCKFGIVFVVSQMEFEIVFVVHQMYGCIDGRMDGWIV